MRAIRQSLIIIGFCFVPLQANASPPLKTVLVLETLAQSGSTRAQFELARRFETGIGTATNTTKAFDFYCKAAAKGPDGGLPARRPVSFRQRCCARHAMAAAWFRRSIELGHPEART